MAGALFAGNVSDFALPRKAATDFPVLAARFSRSTHHRWEAAKCSLPIKIGCIVAVRNTPQPARIMSNYNLRPSLRLTWTLRWCRSNSDDKARMIQSRRNVNVVDPDIRNRHGNGSADQSCHSVDIAA